MWTTALLFRFTSYCIIYTCDWWLFCLCQNVFPFQNKLIYKCIYVHRDIPYSNRGRKTKKKNTKNKKRKIIMIHFARPNNKVITFQNTSNVIYFYFQKCWCLQLLLKDNQQKANYCTTRFKYEVCFCELYLYYSGICFVMWYALALIRLSSKAWRRHWLKQCPYLNVMIAPQAALLLAEHQHWFPQPLNAFKSDIHCLCGNKFNVNNVF